MRGSRATPTRSPATRQLDLRRGAHRPRREDERRDPQLLRAALHRHDGDRAADREAGLGRLPPLGRRPAADRRRPARPDRAAALPVPPAAAINAVPIVGGDFEERALAAALDHQALNQAAASLYRERFDSTPGIVYAAGADHAYNLARSSAPPLEGGRLRPHAAGQARRDARRLRARRPQRPDQRDAARRGLELAARDGRHAPRADGVEAASTSSGSAGPRGRTRARRRASSSTSRRSPPRTTTA